MIKQDKKKQRYRREIAIREIDPPQQHSIEKDVEWICECLGLAENEDDIATGIFKELLRATKEREGITTKEISEKKGITEKKKVTQGAIVYHMNIFMSSGIAIKQGKRYFLRSTSLDETIEQIEEDMLRRMRKLRELAKNIDREMEEMFREI